MKKIEPSGSGSIARPVRHVEIDDARGQRIDNYLIGTLKGVPRSRIYQMLRKGEVRVNGGRVKPTYRLSRGDTVRLPPVRQPAEGAATLPGQGLRAALERAVVFEDDDLLVLDKPAGLAVHGGSGLDFGVIEALRVLRPGVPLALCHRLDRDTSGCLLVAKSRAELRRIHGALRERRVSKRYVALTHGAWPAGQRSVRMPLERYLTRSGERRVRVAASGKPSRSDVMVERSTRDASWLTVHLHTGRTHQIRVHLAAAGHPVVGDVKYADPAMLARAGALGIKRLCLHAQAITVISDGRRRRFEAPVPEPFARYWQALADDRQADPVQHGAQPDEG